MSVLIPMAVLLECTLDRLVRLYDLKEVKFVVLNSLKV